MHVGLQATVNINCLGPFVLQESSMWSAFGLEDLQREDTHHGREAGAAAEPDKAERVKSKIVNGNTHFPSNILMRADANSMLLAHCSQSQLLSKLASRL